MLCQNEQFNREGYVLIRNALTDDVLNIMKNYYQLRKMQRGFYLDSDEGPHIKNRYGDILGESLLLSLKSLFEDVTSKRLFPTYSFFRIYEKGAILARHYDRPACEISGTLVVDFESDYLWPIFMEGINGKECLSMDKGDLAIYRGCDIAHWREKFTGRYWMQIFLHYVDAKGVNAAHKYDRRPHPGYIHKSIA